MTLTPKKIAVVGLGAWGSALALHCARLGHAVTGWSRDQASIDEFKLSSSLKVAKAAFAAPKNLTLTNELRDLGDSEFAIVALPARAWSEVVPHLKTKAIVSATKGLEHSTNSTPLTYAREQCGLSELELTVLSGPSFASDLASGKPISVVAGSKSEKFATTIANSLSSTSLRVYTSTDPLGVELGGILKNVIAIAAGASDALGYGASARAAIISRGLHEMTTLALKLGAQERTFTGLSGLGDLVMTATEDQSRNRTVGLRLGRGESIAEISKSLGATAEGILTAPLALELANRHGIAAPITEIVVRLINATIKPNELAAALMTRPLKSEF